ncbi:response regulator [Deferribacter thermophilus]|uniref:response regulator n=1 Tax=Deferribacter thermophilus TaxID=53573 RepID=UPI003C228358
MNILLIDDEHTFHDIVNLLAQRLKFNFISKSSGEHLQEVLESHKINYAFIDLNLKNESGLKIIELINKLSPETRCFIFSSSNVICTDKNIKFEILDKHKLVDKIKELCDKNNQSNT